MKRLILTLAGLLAITAAASAADRRHSGATFKFGPDCQPLYRSSGQANLYVGTVFGGQNRPGKWGDGTFRDYRTHQACFTSAAACASWVSRNAAHRYQAPAYARCTEVYVGLTPPPPKVANWFEGWNWGQGSGAVRARY